MTVLLSQSFEIEASIATLNTQLRTYATKSMIIGEKKEIHTNREKRIMKKKSVKQTLT